MKADPSRERTKIDIVCGFPPRGATCRNPGHRAGPAQISAPAQSKNGFISNYPDLQSLQAQPLAAELQTTSWSNQRSNQREET
jgi:hypothetical protein